MVCVAESFGVILGLAAWQRGASAEGLFDQEAAIVVPSLIV